MKRVKEEFSHPQIHGFRFEPDAGDDTAACGTSTTFDGVTKAGLDAE